MSGRRPYNDADYRSAKRWLKANPSIRCWFHGCAEPASTIDHVPALMEHRHVRGANCCQLKPACRHHNYSDGAAKGNAVRSADRDAEQVEQAKRWRG